MAHWHRKDTIIAESLAMWNSGKAQHSVLAKKKITHTQKLCGPWNFLPSCRTVLDKMTESMRFLRQRQRILYSRHNKHGSSCLPSPTKVTWSVPGRYCIPTICMSQLSNSECRIPESFIIHSKQAYLTLAPSGDII